MSRGKVVIEACCASVEEAVAADRAGVDRIELCAALPTGGVTPSVGMIEEVRARVAVPIVAMVRPREGRPDPPEEDFRATVRDIKHCLAAGAEEVICGVLDSHRRIDRFRNAELVAAAEGRPVAFHRVFDMTPDLGQSLNQLVDLGFCRVLTSGGHPTVDSALQVLKNLVRQSNGRITILPGGGVRPSNVRALVGAGCRELHFSMRQTTSRPAYGGVDDFEALPSRVAEIHAALGQ